MITIHIPLSLEQYTWHLQNFFDGMVHKLHLNSHKSTPTKEQMEGIIQLLLDEVTELRQQLDEDKFNHNSLVETHDIANFAFLAFVALCNDGVK